MGTTIVAIFAVGGVYVAHVGDSRVYRIRDGKLEQLTEDHSLLNDYIKMKRLTAQEIANFPHKNVIVRALGMKDTVKVDTRFEVPRADDVILLCSDGLSGPVSDEQILGIVDSSTDLRTAARRLVEEPTKRRPRQHHLRPRSLDRIATNQRKQVGKARLFSLFHSLNCLQLSSEASCVRFGQVPGFAAQACIRLSLGMQ